MHIAVPMGVKLKVAQGIHRKSTEDQMFFQNPILTVLPNCYAILSLNDLHCLIASLEKYLKNAFN